MNAPQSPRTSADQARLLRLWEKTEEVAMHFNDLILNFRLRAIGAVTVGAGLFGSIVLTRDSVAEAPRNYFIFASAMVFLAIVWLGLWIIDFGYYSRLLRGAVREATRLEKAISGVTPAPAPTEDLIRLSHAIEDAVAGRRPDGDARPTLWARWWFYALPFGAFLVAAAVAFVIAVRA